MKLSHGITYFNFINKFISLHVVPKGFRIKAPFFNRKEKLKTLGGH